MRSALRQSAKVFFVSSVLPCEVTNTMKNDLEKRIQLKDIPIRGELLPRMEGIGVVSLQHGNRGTNRSGYLTLIPESIAQV